MIQENQTPFRDGEKLIFRFIYVKRKALIN